jgi:hypothetical protein
MAIHADRRIARGASRPGRRGLGWLPALRTLAVGGCAIFAAVAPTHAGEIDGEVGFLASPVSLSVSGSQPVATYTVKLTNTSASNTINNGRLVATTTVVGGLSGAKAVFKSASSSGSCSTSLEGTRVDCSVGSLVLGQSKEFTLTFFSPSSGSRIDLVWNAVFDSGTPPGGSNGDSGTTSIVLEAIKPDIVTSAVPANQLDTINVFTGNLAVPSASDPFAVSVAVPPVSTSTTATVIESFEITTAEPTCKAQGNFRTCYRSSISVPGADYAGDPRGSFLTFVLRVDKSNLRGGAKIDRVVIRYEVDGVVIESNVNFCNRVSDGNGGTKAEPDPNGTPCIDKAEDFSRRRASQGWFGFQWTLISLKNGDFNLF